MRIQSQIFLILLLHLLSFNTNATKTSIIFATLGRCRYTFDIFSLPTPPPLSFSSSPPSSQSQVETTTELGITDGQSVNYNGFFPANTSHLLSLLLSPPPPHQQLESVIYVSERNGSPNIYLDVYTTNAKATFDSGSGSGSGSRRYALQIPTRIQLPLLPQDRSMKDKPIIFGEHMVYVSTHENSMVARKSWAAVYSTHVVTGSTRRLTPAGISDFSPAVSPSGEWTAVASLGEKGWTGEVEELDTGVFVFRTRDGSERVEVVDHGGWPCWADDETIFFHRKSDDGWWSVYKASIGRKGDSLIERVTPSGFHAFTPAAGRGFVAMATRRPSSEFRHIEVLDLDRNVFVEMTRLVSPNFHHYNPFVSPDSGQIGYHRCRGSGSSDDDDDIIGGPLLLENVKSPMADTNLFRIDGSYPSFSPDGTRIAYVGFPGLYVINSDGSRKQKIFSGSAFATAWDWKRKGTIYTSHGPTFAKESTEVDIISITLHEGPQEEQNDTGLHDSPFIKKLTVGSKNNAFPSPSPDGKWVVFRSGRSGHKNLYIMDAVEGEEASLWRLTNGPWTDTMCNWSPNGEWIAFASDRDNPGGGSFAVYFIHPNGTGLRKVVQSGEGGRANHPYFSPDSKSIVFTSDYAAVSAEPISNPHHYQPYGDIFTAHVDGSNIQRLTHNSYEDGTPAWGPAFMKPADVAESVIGDSQCKFDDCHWLGLKVGNYYGSLGCKRA